MKASQIKIAFLNLLVVALLGLFLRLQFVEATPGINYKNFLHAHSHAALLGWLYSVFFITLLHAYLPEKLRNKKVYGWLFWLSQVAVLGMLISFPLQGYAFFSISFSTLHILLSYAFIYRFLKDSKQSELVKTRHAFSFKFVKAALFFLALSSLGPWAMGPIMASGNSFTDIYYNAIYFYLHFQYNGWFTFAALALFFRLLEHYEIPFNLQSANRFFHLFFWSCLPAYLLSVLWTEPELWVYIIAGFAAMIQFVTLFNFVEILNKVRRKLASVLSFWSKSLLFLAAAFFGIKILMQAISAVPYFATLTYKLRHFIIGYLHLVLIGFVSLFLFGYFLITGALLMKNRIAKTGLIFFMLAFFLTEALLFLQGIFYWVGLGEIRNYNEWMFGLSVFLPFGLGLLFFNSKYKDPVGFLSE